MTRKKFRIAMLAPPWETVPPLRYGGTERVVANLTEALVVRGHRVTLFAAGGSQTSARLVATFPRALYTAGVPWSDTLRPLEHVFQCFRRSDRFDLIHNHAGTTGLLFSRLVATPTVTTYHGDFSAQDRHGEQRRLLAAFRQQPFVAISHAQRQRTPLRLHFVGTVPNGIQLPTFPFTPSPGRYLCWLGRITEKKGILEAIAVAKSCRLPLSIGAKIDRVDREFWQHRVKPLVDGRRIRYRGELTHPQKVRLLSGALALLNPITWEEPFGLVMVEAMATGCPVIAFDRGSVREVVRDGVTGFIVRTVPEMVRAINKVDQLDRAACRRWVEQRFTVAKMVEGYERVYERILAQHARR